MDSTSAVPSLPSVLIVDDEAAMRSFLRGALESTARIIEAEDGEHALEILRAPRTPAVDLALVDQCLPRCSGLEILRIARRDWPWIPVVIITGFSSEDLAVQALRAGARDYLRKPFALDTLLQTVGALVPAKPTTTSSEGSGNPNIRRALALVADRFAEPLTLDDAVRAARLSRYHFCRLFRHETGMTFLEYLRGVRIRRATVLLADRYLKITEVAYRVGFSDLSHFDRTFRRVVGRSPTEYRESLMHVEPALPGVEPRRLSPRG
jgi:YesN/AraC family two-component response regulator